MLQIKPIQQQMDCKNPLNQRKQRITSTSPQASKKQSKKQKDDKEYRYFDTTNIFIFIFYHKVY